MDIKPDNVLVLSESLTAPVNVKLTDYGISCTVPTAGVKSILGTVGYQAPEQILSQDSLEHSFDVRVWTLYIQAIESYR